MGGVLLDAARSHPKRQILVLRGHTHGGESMEATWNQSLRAAGRVQREQALPSDV
jgi:hypothetical protein